LNKSELIILLAWGGGQIAAQGVKKLALAISEEE